MAHPQVKSLRSPDDVFRAERIVERSVRIGEQTIGRATIEAGWRWSVHLKPVVGTASCAFHHVGIVLGGRFHVRMDDGSDLEIGPDDVFEIPPGHDAWVVGNEPFESVEIAGIFGYGRHAAGDTYVATLLITDVVDSTATIARIGEREWRTLHGRHYEQIRGALDRHRGVEVATTGDGVLATFDGSARAIRAAAEIHREAQAIGLQVRAGIHIGEVEPVPGNVRGFAVHLASRIAALAGPGDTLVSSTVREMVSADDVTFDDRGQHVLKGVDEPRRLFAARIAKP